MSNQDAGYISVQRGPTTFIYQISGTEVDPYTGNLKVDMTALEATIRPVPLKFPAPFRDLGSNPEGFDFHWESLTYLFNLDDPADFPVVQTALDAAKCEIADRFVTTCRTLATYSLISDGGEMTVSARPNGWEVSADMPSHEAFTGFSATFRQIHNAGDEASFSKVFKLIEQATGQLDGAQAQEARMILGSWREARGKLMNKMVATLVCERLQPPNRPDVPKSFQGVKPDEVILNFNYGDTLHWGERRERLAAMKNDPHDETFYKHACIVAMIQLSHFYFGFAQLVLSALGQTGQSTSATDQASK